MENIVAIMEKIAKMYAIKIKIQNEKQQLVVFVQDFDNAIDFLDQELNKLNQQVQVFYQNEKSRYHF